MSLDLLKERRDFSQKRLQAFTERVSSIKELSTETGLSIYVTGSYGRLEAHPNSDLDLFFVSKNTEPINRVTKTLIDAALIHIAREMEFPPFSNDAQYLEIHLLNDMLEKLGGPEDDFKNFFTARMLLLLESRPVFGEDNYESILNEIIESYFRDFHDHTGDFRPLFLVNDILRFWKTICLNYENKRNRDQDRAKKNKHHIKNLKLKFSRLLICFSTIIPLFASRSSSKEEILHLTKMPPLERLANLANTNEQKRLYNKLVTLYASFLTVVTKPDLQDWIENRENRRGIFAKADEFGTAMFEFLRASLKSPEDIRFLII